MKPATAAYSARECVIGILQCCRCLYPLRHYTTETLHDDACPAHTMLLSARSAGSELVQVGGWLEVSLDIDTPTELVQAADRLAAGGRR